MQVQIFLQIFTFSNLFQFYKISTHPFTQRDTNSPPVHILNDFNIPIFSIKLANLYLSFPASKRWIK